MKAVCPPYLAPYRKAVEMHGACFESLRWTSVKEQTERFAAMTQMYSFAEQSILDAGCGRADFINYLISNNINPAKYIGLEAIPELVEIAKQNTHNRYCISMADFVTDTDRFYVDADVITFSGSLNTLRDKSFYATIKHAFMAARKAIVFNYIFLPQFASASWLNCHMRKDVLEFANALSTNVENINDYRIGNSTVVIRNTSA